MTMVTIWLQLWSQITPYQRLIADRVCVLLFSLFQSFGTIAYTHKICQSNSKNSAACYKLSVCPSIHTYIHPVRKLISIFASIPIIHGCPVCLLPPHTQAVYFWLFESDGRVTVALAITRVCDKSLSNLHSTIMHTLKVFRAL